MGVTVTNKEAKKFCLDLLRADTEEEVIRILKDAGFWEDPSLWRDYGDCEGNFATIGNQQSRPEAALVEKIINAVDARLMSVCLNAGIDPVSSDAPTTIRDAVRQFFPGAGGVLRDWASATRRAEAAKITLAATGLKRHPCITISDCGRGQPPSRGPHTVMPLSRSS